jgi:hypothetical protein
VPVSSNVSFDRARRATDRGITHGLKAAADAALDATLPLVPVLDGDLRDSGKTTVDGNLAAIAFTDFKAPWQHERIGYRHPGGGQAKFLEQGVVSSRAEQAQALAQQIRQELA